LKSLKQQFVQSFKWSFLSETASKLVVPLVFIILANILTPSDFGVISAATIVISFSQVFWDAGLSKALIQRQTEINESANITFWINFLAGLILFILLFILAEKIAVLFKDARIADVIRVLGFQIILSSLSSVHTALFQKRFEFKKLFWIRLFTVTMPGLASIPLAYHGFGYWSLVAGSLSGQFLQTIFLWIVSPWKPKLFFEFRLAKELFKFGSWVMLGGLLSWFFIWMDSVIVGIYLSPHELGLYQTGNTFTVMIFGLFFGPLLPVLYSSFAKISNDIERLRNGLLMIIKIIAMISFPVGFGMFAFRDSIELIVFNEKWQGIGLVIGVLGLAHAFAWIVGANGEAYRAIGRPDIETKIMLISTPIYLIVYLYSVRYGLECLVISRIILVLLFGLIVHLYYSKNKLEIKYFNWFLCIIKPLILCVITVLLIHWGNYGKTNSIATLIMEIFILITMYVLFMLLLEKNIYYNTVKYLKVLKERGADTL